MNRNHFGDPFNLSLVYDQMTVKLITIPSAVKLCVLCFSSNFVPYSESLLHWILFIIYLTQLLNKCISFDVFERMLRAILSKSDNSKITLLLIMSAFHLNCMFWLEPIYLRIKKELIISNAVFSYYNQRSIFVLHLSVWVPCVPSRPFSTGNI